MKLKNRKIKLAACAIALTAALVFGAKKSNAESAWIAAYPAYSYNIQKDSHSPNLRVKGGLKFDNGVDLNGVMNAQAEGKNSLDMQVGHTEFRIHKRFHDLIGPLGQYDLEPKDDSLRLGLIVLPKISENFIFDLRLLPVSFNTGKHEKALDFFDLKSVLYLVGKVDGNIILETYWQYSILSKALYGEGAIDYMISKNFGVGVQARHNFNFEGDDATTLIARSVIKI